ncbi:hypothetical protein [Kozakia baliensis]|uniref:hypothetical protein n=1 Tax=Kozakia baliensis TaxID=153496 RepID=UPI00221F49B5|nr:hypothetical protein [Kozakia baliensis]
MNFSAGFLLNPLPRLNIAVDAYQITVTHRIVEGGVYNGQRAISALEAGGYQVDSTVTPTASPSSTSRMVPTLGHAA